MITLDENSVTYVLVEAVKTLPIPIVTQPSYSELGSADTFGYSLDKTKSILYTGLLFPTDFVSSTIFVANNQPSPVTQLSYGIVSYATGATANDSVGEIPRMLKYTYSSFEGGAYAEAYAQALVSVPTAQYPVNAGTTVSAMGEAYYVVNDLTNLAFDLTASDNIYSPFILPPGSFTTTGTGTGTTNSTINYKLQMVIGRYYEKAFEFNVVLPVTLQGNMPSGLSLTGKKVSGTITFTANQTLSFLIDSQIVTVTIEPIKFPIIAAST